MESYLDNRSFKAQPLSQGNSSVLMKELLKNKLFSEKERTLSMILGRVFECFQAYILRVLFVGPALEDDLFVLYPVAARIRYQKTHVYIRYEAKEAFSQRTELQTAVDRANACCIRDYLGRRLCFSVAISVEK
jgi:hypothetical protein